MSTYPPYIILSQPSRCSASRVPITPEEYSKYFEPPFPAGATITANTPVAPPSMYNQTLAPAPFASSQSFADDMAVENFIAHTSGRGAGGHIDNILRQNKGKLARVRMSFNSGSNTTETKMFTGIIEAAARDHIVLSDPQTGVRYLLLMVYLDYVEFPEEINYWYPGTNTLNVADEKFLKDNQEIVPLYQYQKAKNDQFIAHLENLTLKNR